VHPVPTSGANCSMATWRPGDLATWRPGDLATVIESIDFYEESDPVFVHQLNKILTGPTCTMSSSAWWTSDKGWGPSMPSTTRFPGPDEVGSPPSSTSPTGWCGTGSTASPRWSSTGCPTRWSSRPTPHCGCSRSRPTGSGAPPASSPSTYPTGLRQPTSGRPSSGRLIDSRIRHMRACCRSVD
jgi:hypothetical protein